MRIVVLFALVAAGAAHADQVYVQHSGSNITWDPLHAMEEDLTGLTPYRAEADLLNGIFRGYAAGSGRLDQNAYAGTGQNTLTNISGKNLVLQHGWFKARVDGTIALNPSVPAGWVNSTEIIGGLSMTHNSTVYNVSARQGAAVAGSYAPGTSTVTSTFFHEFAPIHQTNGTSVIKHLAFLDVPSGQGALDFELVMPSITLAPGDSFFWFFSFQASVNTGTSAEADFYNTARLEITLPEGFEGALSVDGVNAAAYSWINAATPPNPDPVPEPGTLLLVGGGAAFWMWRRRTSRE